MYFGEDFKEKYDIYVQFLQTYEGVEGDSASIAVATSVISAFKNIPIKQDTAMTGYYCSEEMYYLLEGYIKSRGCYEAGIKNIIVPKSNIQDIIVEPKKLSKVK